MKDREISVGCSVKVCAYGDSPGMRSDIKTALHAFLVAITAKNLSPLWAAKHLLRNCTADVKVVIVWCFDDETLIEALLEHDEDDKVVVMAGGLKSSLKGELMSELGDSEFLAVCTVMTHATLEYGPRNVMQWLAHCVPYGVPSVGTDEDNKPLGERGSGRDWKMREMMGEDGKTVGFVMEPPHA